MQVHLCRDPFDLLGCRMSVHFFSVLSQQKIIAGSVGISESAPSCYRATHSPDGLMLLNEEEK